jgi:hypothetical protein
MFFEKQRQQQNRSKTVYSIEMQSFLLNNFFQNKGNYFLI